MERGKELAMDMCAKVSGGCAHNNQEVSRDLHLRACLSHCVLACVRVHAGLCLCGFGYFEHNHSTFSPKASEPGSLTD